ncbi:alpha/beta fold hydrolase [Pseudonocardia sp. H11422]|uniref:alpha/beta fold hydrolase n=1 Tax=Pseudonocardia sp. H11422 TaxID=2835866 RepID=UPI001BDD67FD|nr:alpha/beta hydrolase [Pseudonocardia sp. H11422]
MPWASADDGCEIYYETRGSGPPVVFASGFMGITDIWRAQIDALSDRYTCIAFDNRGNGRSEKPLPRIAYGVERHARDLEAVLTAAGVSSQMVIVGHSMGGNTASTYYLAHPDRVAGLVYVGSYVSGGQIHGVGNTLEKIKAAVATAPDRVAFYQAVGLPESIALESAKWPLYAVLGNAESFIRFDLGERVKEITVPCLVLHGDSDIVSPLDPCGYGLQSVLPDAALEVFEGVNHCPAVEAPEKATALIAGFLERVLPR